MDTNIENLVKLQAVELERSRLTQLAKALPAEIHQAESALAATQAKTAAAADALDRKSVV